MCSILPFYKKYTNYGSKSTRLQNEGRFMIFNNLWGPENFFNGH